MTSTYVYFYSLIVELKIRSLLLYGCIISLSIRYFRKTRQSNIMDNVIVCPVCGTSMPIKVLAIKDGYIPPIRCAGCDRVIFLSHGK